MARTLHRFRRPGQCCGNCRHMITKPGAETSDPWGQFLCDAHAMANGDPLRLPVTTTSGTHCAFWRPRPGIEEV